MERLILLIDDDIDEMDFFLYAQKEMPGIFRCTYMSSAVEATGSLLNLQPDLVFLDMNMPAMNGLEFLEHLKKKVPGEQIPIVLYSTHITDDDCRKAKQMGAADCIKKPVRFDSFRKMLEEELAKL